MLLFHIFNTEWKTGVLGNSFSCLNDAFSSGLSLYSEEVKQLGNQPSLTVRVKAEHMFRMNVRGKQITLMPEHISDSIEINESN